MRMVDIILKKRNGGTLSQEEIAFVIHGYTIGEIPDYQIAAWLMAVYFRGMDDHETAWLTEAMAKSGDQVDLSSIPGIKVDKHSTGGVGDKTTLIVAPIVAACGVPVAKMSGRGLGHTGGTVDKLESIPGFRTTLEKEQFLQIVREQGLCVIGQSGNIAPADKLLYALRDVTATVDNISLIASSVMSKKIAAGADAIVLDVKTGSGAFMKTREDAVRLAKTMVAIGDKVGRKTVALITNMDIPLGHAIGNSLEVIEAVDTLKGKGPKDLAEVCLELAANMLFLAKKGTLEECRGLAGKALSSGAAFDRLKAMTSAQGGDASALDDPAAFGRAPIVHPVCAPKAGFISAMKTDQCGIAAMVLGAGRETKGAAIDHRAGILLTKKIGEPVTGGEVIAQLHTSAEASVAQAEKILLEAIAIGPDKPAPQPLIFDRIE